VAISSGRASHVSVPPAFPGQARALADAEITLAGRMRHPVWRGLRPA